MERFLRAMPTCVVMAIIECMKPVVWIVSKISPGDRRFK